MSHRTRHSLLTVLALLMLTGCIPLSDAPPPPEVQPLEIVVESRTRPDRPCLLNVSQVRAGDHDVTVISERGLATVRILDQRGAEVYKTDTSHQQVIEDEAGNTTIRGAGEDAGMVGLQAGRYTVECQLQGSQRHTTPLAVKPARPSFRGSEGRP